MIRFRADTNKGTVIGLGLSKLNVERIQNGKPILVPLSSLGIETEDKILLFYGEDERSMSAEMRKVGLLTDDTEFRDLTQPEPKKGP